MHMKSMLLVTTRLQKPDSSLTLAAVFVPDTWHTAQKRGERHTPFWAFTPHLGGRNLPDLHGRTYGLGRPPPRKPPADEPAPVTMPEIVKLAT